MKGYLEEALADYRMDIKREATTPAREDLFDIKPNSIPLEKPKVEVFHSIAAKLLYESTRECIDLLLAIAFLCTCASRRSTKQGQAKLKRVHEYVKSTIDLECTIGTNDIGRRRTWVDASFAVHGYMKSHTGGVVSFRRCGLMCTSRKQTLNVKSSTEAEQVGWCQRLPPESNLGKCVPQSARLSHC